uniref:Fe2OG dioxygenase domain-containing protein n=1 Tax=Attheya septentrionalis TaxID=420275 RepID=A0A7S2XT66_9STRA|mmetsp:Transcript_6795/g.12216  ORF Transcript_6795/g.12216 Transcript_6795/m.12216 type:complete len:284 (+) Transcript_6795:34-885(+)
MSSKAGDKHARRVPLKRQKDIRDWAPKRARISSDNNRASNASRSETIRNQTVSNDVAEALASRLGVKPEYLTEDGLSWVILVKAWMPTTDTDTSFSQQWDLHPATFHPLKLFGKTVYENRWSQAWGFNYAYSGNVAKSRNLREDDDDSAMVRSLMSRANQLTSGIMGPDGPENPYNGCLQNWYEPNHQIGLHSDDEKEMRNRYPIFSLSWGGARRFVLKARADTPSICIYQKREYYVQDGDLLVMGGTCQKTHKHEVPKLRVTMDPPTSNRINWTIRSYVPRK